MKLATFLQFAIGLVLFLLATSGVIAQDFVPDSSFWETKSSMNQARSYFPAARWGRKIYAFGGITANNGVVFTYTNSIEEYDIIQDMWVVKGTLPQPMAAMAAVELNGAIYIIGGVTDPAAVASSAKVYRYFPVSGTFDADTIAPLPAPRSYLSACAVGDKIYAIGGATGFLGAVTNTVYVYDPSKNTWSAGPNLKVGRAAHTCAVVGSKIYVLGGSTIWTNTLNAVEVLDTDAGTLEWKTSDKPLSHARAIHGSAVLSNVIYAFGGIGSTLAAELSVEAFDPEKAGDNWEAFESLSYERRAFGCVGFYDPLLGPCYPVYIMGGNSGNTTLLSSTQRFVSCIVGANEALPGAAGNTDAALSNFPNPFNQNTTIKYQLDNSANITISIFDIRGQLISIPVSGLQIPGEHHVPFDGTGLEPGVYFCVLRCDDGTGFARKMVVMR